MTVTAELARSKAAEMPDSSEYKACDSVNPIEGIRVAGK